MVGLSQQEKGKNDYLQARIKTQDHKHEFLKFLKQNFDNNDKKSQNQLQKRNQTLKTQNPNQQPTQLQSQIQNLKQIKNQKKKQKIFSSQEQENIQFFPLQKKDKSQNQIINKNLLKEIKNTSKQKNKKNNENLMNFSHSKIQIQLPLNQSQKLSQNSIFTTDKKVSQISQEFQNIQEQKTTKEKISQEKENFSLHRKNQCQNQNNICKLNIRPFARKFLENMSQICEIVIFTAGTKDYALKVSQILDPEEKIISHILSREQVTFTDRACNEYHKNLDKLGRNLDYTVIVDNDHHNFQYQPFNGIQIQEWHENPNDIELQKLQQLLLNMINNRRQVPDFIKEIIKQIEEQTEQDQILIQNKYSDNYINQQAQQQSTTFENINDKLKIKCC
ncbi:HAD-like domain [Pseudocohnilembus persalinus]|uniref:Mitochondrial import inner membrane translocase subunit TIM50 n=1 Tax=Pseudocohnilembus persalinus TaxID=266149 RepID=A0A0V0R0S3_PSEPJ|nr:HAD-like domain [Pseudocohnilembus persalinus]|eukprot:KRX08043.1 HAD-like domain [Pseudocohnilembus persalinus]